MAYSVLIKNGTILDGGGGNPYVADIGVSDSQINYIGNLSKKSANVVIDASNLYVTPGFIDLTNHSDIYNTMLFMPLQESLLMQGVTTILLGNCGESLAPLLRPESLGELERWTSGFSISANWNTVDEYLASLEKIGLGLNIATLVGQETLKRNAKTLGEQLALLESALKDGAAGLSSNFNMQDWSSEIESDTLKLLKIVNKYDALYKIHLRDEGKNFLPSVASAVNLARSSNVRTVISHLKAVGRGAWKDFAKALYMIQNARKEKVRISYDFFPYLRTGSMLLSLLPAWAKEGQQKNIVGKLSDWLNAQKILEEMRQATLHSEKMLLASASIHKENVGETVKEIAEKIGMNTEETILHLLKINQLNATIFGKTINGKNLLLAAKDPDSIVASDGAGYNLDFKRFGNLVHPRSFGAFPRFFNKIAQKAGLKAGDAVKKMTSMPASAIGLKNKGLIKTGCSADIAIFHPEEFRDQSTYKSPYAYAAGLKHLLVNGRVAVRDAAILKERNGKILKLGTKR